MIQGTTPVIKIQIQEILDINDVSKLIFTFKSLKSNISIQKDYPDKVVFKDNYFYVSFNQQDTLLLAPGVIQVEAQVIYKNNRTLKSVIHSFNLYESIHTEAVTSPTTGDIIDNVVSEITLNIENNIIYPLPTKDTEITTNVRGFEEPLSTYNAYVFEELKKKVDK